MSNFSLVWEKITVRTTEKWESTPETKTILNQVSGYANSGSLIAIMGTSGCGKTTLLGAISGRLKDKSGNVKLNNTTISDDIIKNLSGYVHQHDIFTETLTVLEHLKFMAALQLSNETKAKSYIIIKKLLFELGLELQGNTTIRHLSGGEKRRLSLATELLKNPPILFCDEPTTGLDSYSAISVMQKLQTIAVSGKIVLTTIHQPSSELFEHFHDIILMNDGELMFQGTTSQAKEFFESINLHCPLTYNPADFYLKCITHEEPNKIQDHFKTSQIQFTKQANNAEIIDNNFFFRPKHSHFFTSLNWLLWRNFINTKRNISVQLLGYLVLMLIAVTVSSTYAFVKLTDHDSIQNIQGVLISIVSELAFTNMYAVIHLFPEEVVIYMREKHLYSSHVYFISKFLILVPTCLVTTFGFTAVTFFFVQILDGYVLWLKMTFSLFLMGMACCGLGLAFSANCSKIEHAEIVIGSIETLLVLLSGFWIKLNSLPLFINWIQYLSPFFYGFQSLTNLYWRNITHIGNCEVNSGLPCFQNGTEVLESYGVYTGPNVIVYNVIYINLLTLFFCLIGWAGIYRRSYYANVY